MYSRLDSIFRTQFLGPEPTDTGLHIRHEEEKDERHSPEDDGQKTADDSLWTDSTEVSVEAVQSFLETLLLQIPPIDGQSEDGHAAPAPQDGVRTPDKKEDRPPVRKAASPQARAAIAAYQHTVQVADDGVTLHQTGAAPDNALAAYLSAYEIRMIHKLIARLKTLTASGVRHLSLQPAPSFLQSLMDAAENA